MKPTTTRTLNPLPFQDLEPHRFEDLIRQLAYDLRSWKSLEAIGRGGSDEGLDIRAVELVPQFDEHDCEHGDGEPTFNERVWAFQCKREKQLGPKRVRKVVEESLASFATPPHGFVLAVACDVTKRARDVFRAEVVARGIEEFSSWAKGELEDMLFQPKNDHLLFVYFGISLQPRRRSLATTLRSQIAKKKQLAGLLGEDDQDPLSSDGYGKLVLLRDPTDERYPRLPGKTDPPPRWLTRFALSLRNPGHLVVLDHEHLAATTPDISRWDAIFDYDVAAERAENELGSVQAWSVDDSRQVDFKWRALWEECVSEEDRASLKLFRSVPLDRILAIDPLGDGYYPVPHVLVDFDGQTGPYASGCFRRLERANCPCGSIRLALHDDNRARVFPKPDAMGFGTNVDDTDESAVDVSKDTQQKLAALLAAVADQQKQWSTGDDATGEERREQVRGKMKSFREWRDAVALPVFNGFVHYLRAHGHSAKVVPRSVDAAHGRFATESVELRLGIAVGSPANPTYHARGFVRASISELQGYWITVSPEPSRERGNRLPTGEPPTKEHLEAMVVLVLTRLART